MRAAGITLISLALTSAVIGNAYYQKKQFYPSVVYITKSNPSMAVIYVQAFILVILMGKLMRKVFFGQLRAAEFEHLMERSWYAVTETCLAFTVFRDDFSPKFVALFTVLLFLKSFHWLAEDRVDFMERSPVISWLFHIRVLSLLTMLGALDLSFVGHAYQSTITKGASVQLVFGFEYAILLTITINIAIKYALHTIDLNSENPWDNKAVFLLYTELVMGFFKVFLYIAFVAIMVRIYTLPLFAFRPMYYTMRSFKKAFNDVILSRRAIRNMNTLYPDATPEELAAADNVCIICREEMVTASKKLPCNHIFHTSCLRSWFQRQQTCPTCRLNILRTPAPNMQNPATPQVGQPQAQQPQGAPAAGLPQPPAGINPFQPLLGAGPFPFWQPFQQPFQQPPAGGPAGNNLQQAGESTQQPSTSGSIAGTSSASGTAGSGTPISPTSQSSATFTFTSAPTSCPFTSTPPQPPSQPGANVPLFCPPLPFMPFIPPPMPPADFSGFSMEELQWMEGVTRESVEARLKCLHNIQVLLDASVTLMLQYSSAAASSMATASVATAGSENTTASFAPASSSTYRASASSSSRNESSEGAFGFTPEPSSPASEEAVSSTLTKEQEEIRRRRIQKFGQTHSSD
ncbi:E3 ubiquitin-protein ligase synoviolin isoform X3 [Cryptotermes secundus]|uniref:E3 ubiquitin-protein ligase synoviolin isoform X3 n=1 Tax=Cryptotermes secundus TaxID=105785 RepID=UPI000CD7D135|nr:E3 ubiquitin-protein ligase synoviolin isoform X3 [Cryptotermes secundus]